MNDTNVILWDWNGTLLDDVEYTRACLNWLLAAYGYPQRYSLEAYREVFGFPIEAYYVRAGFDFSRHPYPMLAKSFMDHYIAGAHVCRAMPDAPAVLSALRDRGYRHVILSASPRDILIEQVSARGLRGCFDELLGLGDIYGASKVQVGLDWLRRSGIAPNRAVMIGDTLHDAEVAAALGARGVLCSTGHQSRRRLAESGCTVCGALSEVLAVLQP